MIAATPTVGVLPPARPGWWRTLLAVIAGSIVAGTGWLVFIFVLSWVHLLPVTSRELPGAGWPWRIDGAWAFAADLGPMLGVGFVFAAATAMYLDGRTGVRSRRWPLALVAAAVGWFAGVRHGLVVVSGSAALLAVVIAAHHWSTAERRTAAWPRPVAAAVAVAVLGLGLASISYSALHPLVGFDDGTAVVMLVHGRSSSVPVDLASGGPLDARVSAIGLGPGGGATGLRLAAVALDSGRRSAPTLAGLFRPFGVETLAPGAHRQLFLTFAAAACHPRPPSPDWIVSSLVMRLRVAGIERTVGVPLAPPLRVRCGQPAPRARR